MEWKYVNKVQSGKERGARGLLYILVKMEWRERGGGTGELP